MTAAIARVRATYGNAGDHRENASNAAVAVVAKHRKPYVGGCALRGDFET
jgi:hypothetical protein